MLISIGMQCIYQVLRQITDINEVIITKALAGSGNIAMLLITCIGLVRIMHYKHDSSKWNGICLSRPGAFNQEP